jgi:hypothetical protein
MTPKARSAQDVIGAPCRRLTHGFLGVFHMTASIRVLITGSVLTLALAGVVYDAASVTDLDHSTSVQAPALLSGTAGSQNASTVVIDHLSGSEIIVAPADPRAERRALLSPHREPKGVPQRNAPKMRA